ncbi:small heat shock protein, chloroplastic-like [Bidens hawaiensis]|uniref:small heat shock protein, chloroplastic-like n=1 Tax=Bidens hawaiensis TaxID=980011 RepID=UPI00404B5FD6
MAAVRAVKRGTTSFATSTLFNKLLNPVRSVSTIPCVRRCFNTSSSQPAVYDEDNRDINVDRSSHSSVSRIRDCGLFTDMFDPFSTTRSLSQVLNTMDRLIANPLGGGFGTRRGWDAKEYDEYLSFRFDMPGIDKENIKISVEDNTLVILAEAEKEANDDEPPRRYSSRIDLPGNAYKFDEIKAELKNGVLKIRVPKVKEEERKDVRQIQVE